jgi:hypothetical protein
MHVYLPIAQVSLALLVLAIIVRMAFALTFTPDELFGTAHAP